MKLDTDCNFIFTTTSVVTFVVYFYVHRHRRRQRSAQHSAVCDGQYDSTCRPTNKSGKQVYQKQKKTKPRRKVKRGIQNQHFGKGRKEDFVFRPIGHIQSCFPACRGTPRQGILAPQTRATLVLTRDIHSCSLEGIKEWSHIWITFVFHKK